VEVGAIIDLHKAVYQRPRVCSSESGPAPVPGAGWPALPSRATSTP